MTHILETTRREIIQRGFDRPDLLPSLRRIPAPFLDLSSLPNFSLRPFKLCLHQYGVHERQSLALLTIAAPIPAVLILALDHHVTYT